MSSANYVEKDFLQHVFSHTILVTITLLLVVLRTFVKLRTVRNIGPEDFAVLLAMLCALIYTAISIREKDYARQQFTISTIEKRLKCVYFGAIFYGFSLAFTKFSFLLQYLRIFHYKTMRIAIWVVFAIVIIYSIWAFFQTILLCLPPSDFWAISKVDKHCVDAIKFYTAHAVLNVVTDVFILLLPIPGLRKLMLPPAQKFGLLMVFMLGGFICVASSLRLRMFAHAKDGVFFTQWAGISIGTWTAIEMNVAIICCCLPPLRPLATRVWRKLRQSQCFKRGSGFISYIISGLSSLISTRKLPLLFLPANSKMATPSKSEDISLDDKTQGTKSEWSDGTISSNTDTNRISNTYKHGQRPNCMHGNYGHSFDVSATNTCVVCFSPCFYTAKPDISDHNYDNLHDSNHQHRRNQNQHTTDRDTDRPSAGRRSSISWLSLTETVHDAVDDDENIYEAYEVGLPGMAV